MPRSWPQFAKSALPDERYANLAHFYEGKHAHHGKRAAFGPELMEFMRQQAVNFGTRIVTDDIVKVDFQQPSVRPDVAAKARRSKPWP